MTKKGLSGQLTQASTLGLHSIKTPAIIGIQQLGYGVEGLTDLLQPYEQTDKKDPEWPGTDS